ncbi:MAG: sensor histidine kinase [Prevotella sp.]|nr:ATP-binding protein [Prevotella sp.]MDD6737890.1 ATP-binding protein [Prevotella sp.]
MVIFSTRKHILFLVAVVSAAVITLCFGAYEYEREHDFRCDILQAKLQLNNHTRSDSTLRLTIIDTLGRVLYDSEQHDVRSMGNHLHRKEVAEALRYGRGNDISRTSEVDGERYFYSATFFPDSGIIVRSSVAYSAPLTASLDQHYTFVYYTLGILLLIALVSLMHFRLAQSEHEKERIKHQLTENAAHELKTPAATIEGYLETLIANPSMNEEQKNDFIGKCYCQSVRLSRLLGDMTMLTRLDHSALSPAVTTVHPADILQQLNEEMSPLFLQRGISVELRVKKDITMQGDPHLLESLFRNLFDNTLAYAQGATLFLVIGEQLSAHHFRFTFADNGVGVPPEHLPRLFERFYRIDKGRSRRLGGTGLGLAIVKNIALHYGGHAEASPTKGGGLTITVELKG